MMISLLFLSAFVVCSEAHITRPFKSCPNVEPMDGLDLERFLGKWYIIEVFAGYNKCMTLDFKRKTGSDELEVTQQREFVGFDKINVKYVNSYTGTLTIKDPSDPAKMTVKWPANVFGSAMFYVVDTDYNKFALTFECQYLYVLSRVSFTILSRTNSLDEETLVTLRDVVTANGFDASDMSEINHSNCTSKEEATLTTDVDENLFGLMDDNEIAKIEQYEGEQKPGDFGIVPEEEPKPEPKPKNN